MNIRLISITSFSIMFLAVAFMPFEISLLICFFVFSLWISLIFVHVMPRIYEGNQKDNAKVNGARNVRPVDRSGTMFNRLVRFVLNTKI